MASKEAIALIEGILAQGITLDQIPAARPPQGTTSNLDDPVSRAYQITICNVVCLFVVCIIVGVRLFTRIRIVKSVGIDDYCTIFALVCWIGETALFQYATRWGAGKHLWDIPVSYLYPNLLRGWVVCAIMYSITMLFIKLSILLMYRRLFPITKFIRLWWFVVFFTVGYSIGGAFSSLFECRPIESTWTLSVASDYCIDTEALYIANAALNVISDLMILVLPMPIVWGLNTNRRKKTVLTVLFLLGSASCLVSILRMRSIIIIYRFGYTDLTWGLTEVAVWSQAELTAAMICACMPCLRPFFERFTPMLFSTERGENSDYRRSAGRQYLRHDSGNQGTKDESQDIEMGDGIKKQVQVGINIKEASQSQESILRR